MERLTNRFFVLLLALCVLSLGTLGGCDDTEEPTGDVSVDTTDDTGTVDTDEPDTSEVDTDEPDTTVEDVEDTEDDVEEDTTEDADTTVETDTTDDDMTDVEDDTDVEEDTTQTGCGYGSITGRVCTPDGDGWLSGVKVSVTATDCDGSEIVIEDTTNSSGFYDLEGVPAGTHTIVIETGSFTADIPDVLVEIGKVTDRTGASTKTCLETRSAKIAVLTGVFDHVDQLLDGLGIVYDLYEGDSADINPNPTRSGLDLLLDLSALLEYDIIVINSGEWYRLFEDGIDTPELLTMRSNLETFVLNGGSMFVTDWAYYWMEMVFPEAVHFYGDPPPNAAGQHSPGDEGPAKVGKLDPNVPATVESTLFETAIGATEMTINFNWAAWIVATGASFQSEVHVLATNAPINPDPFVQQNAPLVVSYKPTATSGTVFFSAFHAAVQPTAQMEAVLNFIIFQL